jgi:hypothetical protein
MPPRGAWETESYMPNRKLKSSSIGAGEGNRTLVCSLGSCRSAIELRPHSVVLIVSQRSAPKPPGIFRLSFRSPARTETFPTSASVLQSRRQAELVAVEATQAGAARSKPRVIPYRRWPLALRAAASRCRQGSWRHRAIGSNRFRGQSPACRSKTLLGDD